MADRNSREDHNRKKFALLKTILNARRQRQLMQQSILNHFIARRRLILKVCALAILLLSFHERSYLFSSCEPPSSLPLLIHNLYWVKSGVKLCLLRQKVQKKRLCTDLTYFAILSALSSQSSRSATACAVESKNLNIYIIIIYELSSARQ